MPSLGFNPNDYADQQPQGGSLYGPIPDGWYAVSVIECQPRMAQAGHEMLSVTYEVDGNEHPKFANRRVGQLLSINHPNEQPRGIARAQVSQILRAAGAPAIDSHEEFIGLRLLMKVQTKPARDGYEARSEPRDYKPVGELQTSDQKPAPEAARATPAWKR